MAKKPKKTLDFLLTTLFTLAGEAGVVVWNIQFRSNGITIVYHNPRGLGDMPADRSKWHDWVNRGLVYYNIGDCLKDALEKDINLFIEVRQKQQLLHAPDAVKE